MRDASEEEVQLTAVSIPTSLHRLIEERIEDSGFASVEEYVTYVLQQVMAEEDKDLDPSQDNDDAVRDRLARLGYL